MRNIKMNVSCCGDNFSFTVGKEYVVSDETAKDLIKAGHAIDLGSVRKSTKLPKPIDTVQTDSIDAEDEASDDPEDEQSDNQGDDPDGE